MSKNLKALVITLACVCAGSLVICGGFFVYQIMPDFFGERSELRYDFEQAQQINAGDGLEIDASSIDVKIVRTTGTMLKVRFEGYRSSTTQDDFPRIEVWRENGRVYVKEMYAERKKYVINIGPFTSNTLLGTLTVEVPDIVLGDSSVTLFSGKIDVANLNCAAAELSTSSGRIAANDIDASNFIATTFSGVVSLGDIRAENGIDIDSSSGAIILDGASARALTVNTFSGAVKLSDMLLIGNAGIDTSSGSIDIQGITANKITVTTFSGSVTTNDATLESMDYSTSSGRVQSQLNKGANITINTFSGSVEVIFPADTGFYYNLDSFSGSRKVDFSSVGGDESGVVGDGSYNIDISTSSGGIAIKPY